jgi:hypothetical protein
MASQVISSSVYTNNTGQNVRVVFGSAASGYQIASPSIGVVTSGSANSGTSVFLGPGWTISFVSFSSGAPLNPPNLPNAIVIPEAG